MGEGLKDAIANTLGALDMDERVSAINELREIIHHYSPFASEPVDFVRWVPAQSVYANDYNPNTVAPPEMELLRLSIDADGYTQPIVSMADGDGRFEVIDGFHRHRVGKECKDIQARVRGYLPLVQIRESQADKSNRMASTIRHNRARGKHQVEAMSEIVIELKKRNWTNETIAKNLGMDADEVLRLCQISGLAEVFADHEFSQAWDVEGVVSALDYSGLDEHFDDGDVEVRTANTSDPSRIFHPYQKWECYAAGFYDTTLEGADQTACEISYRNFLGNSARFREALDYITSNWPNSCEHYLTNKAMNRIAWLGQAAACHALRLPAMCRGGFQLLSDEKKVEANMIALEYLNKWLEGRGMEQVTMDQADPDRQTAIY